MNVDIKTLDKLEGVGSGEPIASAWTTYEWQEALGLKGNKSFWRELEPGLGLYRIDKGKQLDGWWTMDNIIRVLNGGQPGFGGSASRHWNRLDHKVLQQAKALFRMMGLDHRLELCENPDYFPEDHAHNEKFDIQETLKS
ncbi:hypothetical protein ACFY5D_16745 [Paeniglutamicibacter sp. NPDC012692]|uniref:hypothetical protein n=1 Tax=Paeniglutamicibacter sp. NPDC012692 TaxID=3364388 RepID=UPI0036910015